MRWQRRLHRRLMAGDIPSMLDLPTGLGKTSVMAIWLIARAHGAPLPRRLVYIVDRRAVVDQATEEAEKLRANAKAALGLDGLAISTLRGRFVDNRDWLTDPAAPAIVVGTVDMVGSRLLFSGYGVSAKMRPRHAGLLGTDTLVVLDEAHLVPPFAHLLRAIETDPSFRPRAESNRTLVPGLTFLPLSATQREPDPEDQDGQMPESLSKRTAFSLDDEDRTDPTGAQRLSARKRLRLCLLAAKDPDRQLAEAAWELATKDGKCSRVVVFCNRREKADESEVAGPSALGVKKEIEELAKADRKTRHPDRKMHLVELLVGGRRVRERDTLAKHLSRLGFSGKKTDLVKPAFLVATAAGEVGVDIDADHMVSDLVPWERMVQRLGRVNRRGEGDAEVLVFWSEPAVKSAAGPTDAERRALTAFRAKAVLERLRPVGEALDASPGALRALAEGDPELKKKIEEATTPEPLRPALSRALVDAWSMTSLDKHAGRPDVAPWLRGWVPDEQPQTTIVWRRYLPIRVDREGRVRLREDGRPILPEKDIEEFFDAAPPHESEKLETETYRLPDWLRARAQAVLPGKPAHSDADAAAESDAETDAAETIVDDPAAMAKTADRLRREDVAALLLAPDGNYIRGFTLADLAGERKARDRDEFKDKLAGNILIVDARLGGLADGLLDKDSDHCPHTVDDGKEWLQEDGHPVVPFRIHLCRETEPQEEGWYAEFEFDLRRNDEGERVEWLVVEHFKEAAQREDARSVAKPQTLAEHQSWARCVMRRIAGELGLPAVAVEALSIAAGLHDEGKKAWRWQQAFNAVRDAKRCGLSGPLAKTKGPIDQALLSGYRHEFGSLRYVEESIEFQALPGEWRELVLHVVAAHHGFARPVIGTRGCDDEPEAALEQRARDAALRFARLQKRWGPWGLAWWEALLRAADAEASRKNDAPAVEKNDAMPTELM